MSKEQRHTCHLCKQSWCSAKKVKDDDTCEGCAVLLSRSQDEIDPSVIERWAWVRSGMDYINDADRQYAEAMIEGLTFAIEARLKKMEKRNI